MTETDSDVRNNGANTGRNQDGTFAPGNSGRPKGARHKTTLAMEAILDGEAEALTRKAVELAMSGDSTALRLCLERLAPARKSRTVKLELPRIETAADVGAAISAVVEAVAAGEIDPDEGATVAGVIEIKRRSLETVDMDERLARLEEGMRSKKP